MEMFAALSVADIVNLNASLSDIKMLVSARGRDVDERDEDGNTGLIHAASVGNLIFVKYLMEQGADPNAQNKEGKTAFMQVSSLGHLKTVYHLVEAGSNIYVRDHAGRSAKDCAKYNVKAEWGSIERLVNASMCWAVQAKNLQLLNKYIDEGMDVNETDEKGQTPLICSASVGDVDILKVLLSNNVNLEAKTQVCYVYTRCSRVSH